MKHFLLLITLLFSTQLFSQTFTGNLTLSTQIEVNAFSYDSIKGNLTIKGLNIVNISNLNKLDFLLGSLIIDSTNLVNIEGLKDLKSLSNVSHNMQISNNQNLTDISGANGYLKTAISFDNVAIINNPKIEEISSLLNTGKQSYLENLLIDNNDQLKEINLHNSSRINKLIAKNNYGIKKIILPNANYEYDFDYLHLENNQLLDSIDFFEIPFTDYGSLFIKDNPSLTYFKQDNNIAYFKNITVENNNSLTNLNFFPTIEVDGGYRYLDTLRIVNNKNLTSCCVLEPILSNNRYGYLDISGNPFPCNDFIQIITNCGDVTENIVFGRVYIDVNENNIPDVSDIFLDNIKIESLKNGNTQTLITNNSGKYYFASAPGTQTIRPISSFVNFKTIPLSYSVSHNDYGNIDTFNFKVSPEILANDASIVMSRNSLTRPARSNSYTISYTNESGMKYDGTISLVLDPRLTFNSSSITPKTVNGNTFTWDIKDLTMFSTKDIKVNFSASSTLTNNDTLISEVMINNINVDVTPKNNNYIFNDIVRASFDPNNKEVNKSTFSLEELNQGSYLYYTIHFQNIGNDTAFNIYIKDTLSANLNWNTMDIVSASHDFDFEQINGRFISFNFNDILLPDSNVNEEGSKGFITYKIKPKYYLLIGKTMENRASIVFDVNAPIVTNKVSTVIMGTDAGEDQTICKGESTTLTASGALTYTWNESVNSDNYTVRPNTTTTYYLKGKVGDITQIDSVTVFVNTSIEVNQSAAISSGESFNFNGLILTEAGIYRDTIPQVIGCDSIIVLNLSIVTFTKNNIAFVNSLKIYPNPTKNSINIDLTASKQADFKISFFGVNGRVLMVKDYNKTATINESFDLSSLATGIYYMKIESESQNTTYSIIKQ